MGVSYNTNIVRNGLVLYLDAANTKSYPGTGTTWNNLNGSGSNATLVNGVGYSTANNGGMVFDGTNDRGTLTTPITSNSQQTYEVWVKALPSNSATDDFGYILHNSIGTQLLSTYMAIGYAGTIGELPRNEIFAVIGTQWATMGTGVIADANTIRQIVLTWDGLTQTAYVDGIQKVSQPRTTVPSNFSTTMGIGDVRNSTYRQIVGNIYGIKIYNRALSAAEIKQNFEALRGRYGI